MNIVSATSYSSQDTKVLSENWIGWQRYEAGWRLSIWGSARKGGFDDVGNMPAEKMKTYF